MNKFFFGARLQISTHSWHDVQNYKSFGFSLEVNIVSIKFGYLWRNKHHALLIQKRAKIDKDLNDRMKRKWLPTEDNDGMQTVSEDFLQVFGKP